MTLEVTEEERAALLTLVEREVSDLGPEIRHTSTSAYRDDLKDRKRTLLALRQRLSVHLEVTEPLR